MRSRFPHGGEVLGAAPANPILAPVLSQDRGLSMSRQRDLLDLQAIQRIPGLVGYWKNDPQYLYEDSAGTTPASTSGTGPIGQWRDVNNTVSLGPELATVTSFVADNSAGASSLLTKISGTLTSGKVYRITFTGSGFTGTPDYGIANGGAFNYSAIDGVTRLSANGTATGILVNNTTAAAIMSVRAYSSVTISNVSIKEVLSPVAVQWTPANKPILRKTPTTGVYWADSNTSTSALNVALGNLGSACTVARASAEGVTFTENVSITSTYNIAPAFGFNADVAIFNRALTATEKALITRYMQRAVPMLGSNLVTNGTFDTDTVWTKGTGWSIGSGVASKSAGTASNLTQSVGVSGNAYYAKADVIVTAGTIGAYPGSGTTQFGSTAATGTLAYTMKAAGTGIGVRGDASFAGSVDNATIKEIL